MPALDPTGDGGPESPAVPEAVWIKGMGPSLETLVRETATPHVAASESLCRNGLTGRIVLGTRRWDGGACA